MQAQVVNANSVKKIAPSGNRDFLHIQNNSGLTVYICYDGTVPDVTNGAQGTPLPGNGVPLMLNNDGSKQIFTREVYAYNPNGSNVQLNLQGV